MKVQLFTLACLLATCPAVNAFSYKSHLVTAPSVRSTELFDMRRNRAQRYYPNDYDTGSQSIDSGYDRSYENLGYEQNRNYPGYQSEVRRPDSGRLAYRGYPQNFNSGDYLDVEFSRYSNGTRHLWILITATVWFYLYGSFELVAHTPKDYFFHMEKSSLQNYGAFMAFMTLPLYASCTKLLKSNSLTEAQIAVLGIAAVAVPSGVLISVLNPTRSHGWTGVAFAEVTMFLGVFIVHHLRQASLRERRGVPSFEPQSPFEALSVYRPPRYYQSTMVAWDLTRSMVAFHVATSVIGQSLIESKQTFGDLFPFNAQLWPWVLVALHMGHDCMMTALFPANKLRRYLTYALCDSGLYAIQIYAALSSPIMQKWLSVGITSGSHALLADQVLVVAFVTNAALQLLEPLNAFVRALDLDQRFGLTNFYNSGGYQYDYDRRYNDRYGPPGYDMYERRFDDRRF